MRKINDDYDDNDDDDDSGLTFPSSLGSKPQKDVVSPAGGG